METPKILFLKFCLYKYSIVCVRNNKFIYRYMYLSMLYIVSLYTGKQRFVYLCNILFIVSLDTIIIFCLW